MADVGAVPARRLFHGRHSRQRSGGHRPARRSFSTFIPPREPARPCSPDSGPDAGRRRGAARLRTWRVSVPKAGEDVCGDAWACRRRRRPRWRARRGRPGTRPVRGRRGRRGRSGLPRERPTRPGAIAPGDPSALRSTRGAAVAVAEVDLDSQDRPLRGGGQHRRDRPGGRSQPEHGVAQRHGGTRCPQVPGVHLSLSRRGGPGHGIPTGWPRAGASTLIPGLIARDPALIAGVLYRDFQRGRDDVTVLVARAAEEAAQ